MTIVKCASYNNATYKSRRACLCAWGEGGGGGRKEMEIYVCSLYTDSTLQGPSKD
jgi:hypothetical protein